MLTLGKQRTEKNEKELRQGVQKEPFPTGKRQNPPKGISEDLAVRDVPEAFPEWEVLDNYNTQD
jgi:hypothetical protein